MDTATQLATTKTGKLVDLVLCCAASMAREGEFRTAENLLLAVPPEAATPRVFDLMARICAQQSRYMDAEAQWTQAIQRDPDNVEYQQCLRVAQKYRRRPIWVRSRWVVTMLLTVCAVVGITIWRLTNHERTNSVAKTAPSVRVSTANLGTATQWDVIRFRAPIFSVGTKFTDAGRNEIRHFAKQLNAESRVEIEGLADSQLVKRGSKYRDNEELGLARASAVALFLHRETGLPLNQITVVSRPKADPARRANLSLRTVVIQFRGGGT